jgi:type II secretory ATPase GspE/PulE/Tfp pilus assembly ATPase PilB-like protein
MAWTPPADASADESLPSSSAAPQFASSETQAKLSDKMKQLRLQDKERELMGQATIMGLPYMNLQGFPIGSDTISLIAEDDAQALKIICFWFAIGDLRIGAVSPADPAVQNYVIKLGQLHYTEPKVYLISEKSFATAFLAYRSVPKFKKISGGVEVTEAELNRFSESISRLADLAEVFKNVNTTEAISAMVAGALKTRSSDIHIESGEGGTDLRYRIDGVLYQVTNLPKTLYTNMVPRLKLLAGLKINITDRPQDGRFSIHLSNDQVDVRVSTLPTKFGESIVMRILKASSAGIDFDKLGITGRAKVLLDQEIKKPKGMIIATGPTGSGKSTTLYAILNKLNDKQTKIITMEDPIEYKLAGINQSQVDLDAGYTFAVGLRSILRQDPDIIMVGEIRDLETADISANAALTGHLVLSTLHTNNAAGAIPRFLGMGVKPFLLPPALNAVIGQRLVRLLCQSCRQVAEPDKETLKRVEAILKNLPAAEANRLPAKQIFYTSPGCAVCQSLGYKGQIGIYEIFVMNKDIEDVILSQAVSERRIEELVAAAGMVTMVQDGILKALAGLTSLDEVFRVTSEGDVRNI